MCLGGLKWAGRCNTSTSHAMGRFRAVFPGANTGALKYRISGRGVLGIRNSRAWCAAAGQRAGGAGGLLVSLGLYFRAWTWGHGVFPGVDMGVGGGRAADRGGAADRPGHHQRRRRRHDYYYYYYYYYYTRIAWFDSRSLAAPGRQGRSQSGARERLSGAGLASLSGGPPRAARSGAPLRRAAYYYYYSIYTIITLSPSGAAARRGGADGPGTHECLHHDY